MSLFAADQNFEAACFAGWGYKDTTVKSNEQYLYRIIPALPEGSENSIELGFVYISAKHPTPLPKPLHLEAIFKDKSVELSWNYDILSDTYNGYRIEK